MCLVKNKSEEQFQGKDGTIVFAELLISRFVISKTLELVKKTTKQHFSKNKLNLSQEN